MRVSFFLICFLGLMTDARAQAGEWQQQAASGLPLWNPAVTPQSRWLVFLPDLYAEYSTNAGSPDAYLQSLGNGRLVNPDALIQQSETAPYLLLQSRVRVAGLVHQRNRISLGVQWQYRAWSDLTLPRDLIALLWNGNQQFLGQTISVGPALQGISWSEIGVQAGYHGTHWNFGLRLKYLNGVAVFQTTDPGINLSFGSGPFTWNVNSSWAARGVGLPSYLGADSIASSRLGTSLDQLSSPLGSFGGNHGVALDAGIVFQPAEGLRFHAGVSDLGRITWTKDAREYRTPASLQFSGIVIEDLFNSEDQDLEGILDSLTRQLNVSSTSANFNTSIPFQWQIGFQWTREKWTLGWNGLGQHWQGRSLIQASLMGQWRWKPWLQPGVLLGYRRDAFPQWGCLLRSELGPVVVQAGTDNLPGLLVIRKSARPNVWLSVHLELMKS